ncbi:Nacht domain protein [Apiospora saccharicola]
MASAPDDPIVAAFKQAKHKFLTELKDDKIRQDIETSTVDQVYTAIADIQREQGGLRDLQKISPYLDCLKEYAAVIEVFAQVKPDIIALIWGPIKLLLQWTSVMMRSFDAITKTLSQIGELLPEFKRVTALFSWKTLFHALWPTHYEKVKVVISDIERHTRLLRNEVRLEHIEREHEARGRAMKHFEEEKIRRQHEEFHRIKTDASPKSYNEQFLKLQGRVCKGTEKWLLDDPDFQKWRVISSTSSSILWLQGIPGAGKTFIASSVAKALSLVAATRTAVAFLSYSDTTPATTRSVLQSFAFQVVSNDYNLQEVVCQSYSAETNRTLEGTRTFLSTVLACAGPTYLILDGLDEMEQTERSLLLDQLIMVLDSSNETRIFISSRPEADLATKLSKKAIEVPINQKNTPGIRTFVHESMQSWFTRREFWPDDRAEIESCLKPIATKAKGMFLYARIVLTSVEDLDQIDDIRQELTVLPETLEDAYGRILQKINQSKIAARKEKARAVLGWIACAPTPLTIQEMQQALSIGVNRPTRSGRLYGNLNIVEICGPIVEVVDEYVRFVHFTVKEYLFSPQVPGFIQLDLAALDLARRCITYLCQPHHDLDLADDQFYEHIRNGDYALDSFASNMWDNLIQYYLNENDAEEVATEAVAGELEKLLAARRSHASSTIDHDDTSSLYGAFSEYFPELDNFLRRMKEFRRITESSEDRVALDAPWMEFDPLTTSRVSARLYLGLPSLPFCNEEQLKSNAMQIRRWYGSRPYKCGFLHCYFHRTGFESVQQRRSHERHHEKPWKCSIPGCEFQEGGFLSKKMRDDHLERAHRATTHTHLSVRTNLEEKKLILLDLAKEGLMDSIRGIFPADINLTPFSNQRWFREFCNAAGSSGSEPLLKFCLSKMEPKSRSTYWDCKEFVEGLISPSTLELFKEFIDAFGPGKTIRCDFGEYLDIFKNLLIPDAGPHFDIWLDGWVEIQSSRSSGIPPRWFTEMVEATNNDILKEERLLQVLRRTMPMTKICNGGENKALLVIARTTRSCRLAEYLLDRGAGVDCRPGKNGMTALFAATSEDSARAAALAKLLLLRGADPETTRVAKTGRRKAGRRGNLIETTAKVRDQKGAKNIKKWLGVTWDELVADVQRERKEAGTA